MTRPAAVIVTALCVLAAAAFFIDKGRPTPMRGNPDGKVACVSYAPYNKDQTPFDKHLVIPPEQIERDMTVLSAFTDCVRTYATGQGLDKVPEIAERHGLKVYAGAWIGRKDVDNQLEIKRLIAAANAHPEAIRGLIVGNEVILRGEQTAAALAAYVGQVRAGLNRPLPITYADVWEFWLQHPELADAVDFVTIHLLPYWEDDPTPIDGAITHVMAVWEKMRDRFAPKPILIGEVGWPSEGRRREGAEPSLRNETRFVRDFIAAANAAGATYNLIESFDQPWKRELEGTVGGAWGFFDADRKPKVTLSGPVVEWPDAPFWGFSALAVGLLPLAFALIRRERMTAAAAATLGMGGIAAGAALSLQTHHALAASRDVFEWTVNLGWLAFSVVLAWGLVRGVAGLTDDPHGNHPCPCEDKLVSRSLLTTACGQRFVALFGMTVASLGLLFNSRYRDFPVSMFLIPAVGFALLRLPEAPREQKAVAALLGLTAIGMQINEGWLNTQAWVWTAAGLLLAVATLIADRRPPVAGRTR